MTDTSSRTRSRVTSRKRRPRGRAGRKLLAREQRRDEGVGLVALASLARRERDALFAGLQRDWLGSAGSLLEREIDDLLRALAPSS
jgi:hypothetical protein